MEEKFYTIGTHTSRQYNEIRRELISEGNNRSSVPSRIVTNSDEIKHSGNEFGFKVKFTKFQPGNEK